MEKPKAIAEEIPSEIVVKKANKPLASKAAPSLFSIKNILEEKPVEDKAEISNSATENLPAHHFTETDLQTFWQKFLEDIRKEDLVVYNAISGFKLKKTEEHRLEIRYPSFTAKAEFDKVSKDFFNGFMHAVNNHSIEFTFENMGGKMKKQAVTKKTIFEKYCEINPLLRELDSIFKLDLN